MSCCLRTALIESLSGPLGLGKSRLETLNMLLVGLIHSRTVNLSNIASQCHGPAHYTSKYRRLQHFFQHVRLDQAVIAALVVRMLKLARPKCLAHDRTCWKLGRWDVNILMLAIVTRRFRVPLLWSVLAQPGSASPSCSATSPCSNPVPSICLLDGAGWHTKPGLAIPEGLRLIYLPPYTPKLQPAEHLWRLGDEAIVNRHFDRLAKIQDRIE